MDETAPLDSVAGKGGADRATPGGTIGRFVVIGLLGRGGMGVVLSAYDPVLDRRVALKLLRSSSWSPAGDEEGRARLQREAQAMARLPHPNVVAVHDVGTVDGQLFIAMEFVDGVTLRAWQAQSPRSVAEIVGMYVEAGRGLQAAHAAGLVHGDFKPENVLIGSDGRARVGDFGLASVEGGPGGQAASADNAGGSPPRRTPGTPGYIAPERLRGATSDAQSDQFSFCVALYEAVYGQHPFAARSPSGLRPALLEGALPAPPRRADVPRALAEAILRGLRPRREERWPSMAALLDELARHPDHRRRRLLLATAASLAVVAALVAVRLTHRQRAAECGGAGARMAGVWDGARREAARQAFTATRLPFAADTFARVAASLDAYTGGWAAMHEEACRANRVEGRQSDTLFDLRVACLDRHRATLAALTSEWARGVDAQALENAIAAAASLPPLDECADARTLTDPIGLPRDPVEVARIEGVRSHLDRARALGNARRMQEARQQAELARAEAEATGFAPVRAEAALVLGSLSHGFLEPGAAAPLQDATRLAELAHDDRLAAQAAIELTAALADGGQAPAAIQVGALAEALVVRAGDRAEQRGALLGARGAALSNAGRYRDALAVLTEARSILRRTLGDRDPLTLGAGRRLLGAVEHFGDPTARGRLSAELLQTTVEVFGPEHPESGIVFGRRSMYYRAAGDLAAARDLANRSLTIAENAFGTDSLHAAVAINGLGVLDEDQGHLGDARARYERVLEIRRRLLPPGHPLIAHALANLSIIDRLQGRLAESRRQVEEAIGLMRAHYGPAHTDVAYETGLLAEVLADQGSVAAAAEHYQRAIDLYQQSEGPQSLGARWEALKYAMFLEPQGRCVEARPLAVGAIQEFERLEGAQDFVLAQALLVRARCDLRDGAIAEAVKGLQRAGAIFQRPGMALSARGAARFELARALRAGGSSQQPLALALEAERELVASGPLGARDLKRVRAWLRAQPGAARSTDAQAQRLAEQTAR